MRRLARRFLTLSLVACVVPAVAHATHVGIDASVGARLVERSSSSSWRVEVTWTITCTGVGPGGATYNGYLYLIDVDTAEETFLGGVFTASGKVTQIVSVIPRPRYLRPELRVNCIDDDTLHGSGTVVVAGAPVLVPGRYGAGATGGGGGGSSGSGDPTEPLRSGGCRAALVGTDAGERIVGGGAGEIVLGLGGDDEVRGRGGDDCLLGGVGNDRLHGEEGFDRLTGGPGRDTLVGGAGTNAYDAGDGSDVVAAANGRRETVRCGRGHDTARVDRRDRVFGCERITRVG